MWCGGGSVGRSQRLAEDGGDGPAARARLHVYQAVGPALAQAAGLHVAEPSDYSDA